MDMDIASRKDPVVTGVDGALLRGLPYFHLRQPGAVGANV